MNYKNHQHLKLRDLSLHPKQYLKIISMLTNGQPYPVIQKYIRRTLKEDILKSTISNLKHKVITARALKVPLPYLLDERKRIPKSASKHDKHDDRITLLICINSMIRAYYADIKSQTLSDKQRKALIQLIKIKLQYGSQLRDEVLDYHTLDTVLEINQRWSNAIFAALAEVTKNNKALQTKLQQYLDHINNNISNQYDTEQLEIMKSYCKRHHILWDGSFFDEDLATLQPSFHLPKHIQ